MLQPKRPLNLATSLMRHFDIDLSLPPDQSPSLKLSDFVASVPEWETTLDVGYLMHTATQLVNQGLLTDLGGIGLERCYIGRGFSETNASYGSYENRVGGPVQIFKRHCGSVVPVLVKENNGDIDIGTGFFVGNANTLLTARHVVENKRSVEVLDADGNPCAIENVRFHVEPNVDLAIILLQADKPPSAPPFRTTSHILGESILSIGFPPIPGFDRLRVLEHGEIGSEIKVMNGEVVSSGMAYHEGIEYFLINARVKGGSSGAPVLNNDGFVVGIVASTALSVSTSVQLEGLGYGIVTPSLRMREMLDKDKTIDVQFKRLAHDRKIDTTQIN